MTGEGATALFAEIVGLVDILVWPLIAGAALLYFGAPIKKFLSEASNISFKVPGLEASASRQEIEAAIALGAAKALAPDRIAGGGDGPAVDVVEMADAVLRFTRSRVARGPGEPQVLWVDDHPDNNLYERAAMESLGMRITTCRSTEDAIAIARTRRFDVIVTDMGRSPDARAGYTLLKQLRANGNRTPLVIYSGDGGRQEHRAEAREQGAYASISAPQELLDVVREVIEGRPMRAALGTRAARSMDHERGAS